MPNSRNRAVDSLAVAGLAFSFVLPGALFCAMLLIAIGIAPPAPWSTEELPGFLMFLAACCSPLGLCMSLRATISRPSRLATLGCILGAVGSICWAIVVIQWLRFGPSVVTIALISTTR